MAEISRIIRERAADGLVIDGHSMDQPEHPLFGSTAKQCLHHIQCSTVVIPPPRVEILFNA
jgi:nucleotide-binding universal stress UspA family protein